MKARYKIQLLMHCKNYLIICKVYISLYTPKVNFVEWNNLKSTSIVSVYIEHKYPRVTVNLHVRVSEVPTVGGAESPLRLWQYWAIRWCSSLLQNNKHMSILYIKKQLNNVIIIRL